MGQEIERNFLVASDGWCQATRTSRRIVQGYLTRDRERSVRIRIAEDQADEFDSPRSGLILAELELERADQSFDIPGWIGQEISGDPQYFNQNMI
jgi:CYTH domain-containing protein